MEKIPELTALLLQSAHMHLYLARKALDALGLSLPSAHADAALQSLCDEATRYGDGMGLKFEQKDFSDLDAMVDKLGWRRIND